MQYIIWVLVDSNFFSPLQGYINHNITMNEKEVTEVETHGVDYRNGKEEQQDLLGHYFNAPNEWDNILEE